VCGPGEVAELAAGWELALAGKPFDTCANLRHGVWVGAHDNFTTGDLREMQGLAQRVTTLQPELLGGEATFGELAWSWGQGLAAAGDTWRRRLVYYGGELIGWGWAYLPRRVVRTDGSVTESRKSSLAYQYHPDHPEVFGEVLAWFENVTPDGLDRWVTPPSPDTDAISRLSVSGYVMDEETNGDDGDWHQYNRRTLEEIEKPQIPEGFRFTTAAQAGPEAAVQAHVAAWHPSAFDARAYQDVLVTPGYRADLHVLLVAPGGAMASTAVLWFDEMNRSAEFEPVGTDPDFRRRGLGRALLLHGMHVVRDAGATEVTVACVGAPKRPAARNLYYSVGFEVLNRDLVHVKRAVQ
jgi:GNAT superfamily N-acetyltransferase